MPKRKTTVTQVKKKLAEWLPLFKYEEDYYWRWLVDQCDKYFSLIVRLRDCWDAYVACVTKWIPVCKWPITKESSQCCHWIRRGFYSHRWDFRNAYAGCSACNCFGLQDHYNAITTYIINTHWLEVWEEMRYSKNMKIPKIRDLEELLESLKTKYEAMITSV